MKSQNNNETIGDKIKQLRNKQGLTQDELARKADLPYTTLTKIESNVITKPSIQTVVKIANGLGITIDSLLKEKYGKIN
jgi:transcriptional regulator with XRE-family HTH domain